jgi:hypothetical protein
MGDLFRSRYFLSHGSGVLNWVGLVEGGAGTRAIQDTVRLIQSPRSVSAVMARLRGTFTNAPRCLRQPVN